MIRTASDWTEQVACRDCTEQRHGECETERLPSNPENVFFTPVLSAAERKGNNLMVILPEQVDLLDVYYYTW